MKLYRQLNQHRVVRGAVKLLSGIQGHSTADAEETEARKSFRAAFYGDVLQHNETWQPVAIALLKSLPDPLADADVLAYGAALRGAAQKFAFISECTPEQFLTDNEQRLCKLDALLTEIIASVNEQVHTFAADMKLGPRSDGRGDTGQVYHALGLLALYRTASAEQRDTLFELLDYTPDRQVEIIVSLVGYMERGFSRAESIDYLRRRGHMPAELAQRAVAAHVVSQGFTSCEADARAFAHVLRELHMPDDRIAAAWYGAGLEPLPIEEALAGV